MERDKPHYSDVVKSLAVAVVVAGAGAFINVNVLQSEMSSVKEQINKLDGKIEKMDGQVRKLEIKQAEINTVVSSQGLLAKG